MLESKASRMVVNKKLKEQAEEALSPLQVRKPVNA
jgi:hypothetical protein